MVDHSHFLYLNQAANVTTLAQVFVANLTLSVMVSWIYLRSGHNIWASVVLHGSQTLFSIFTSNIAPALFNQYWIISYSVIALALLVLDWRMWFARPAADSDPEIIPTTA